MKEVLGTFTEARLRVSTTIPARGGLKGVVKVETGIAGIEVSTTIPARGGLKVRVVLMAYPFLVFYQLKEL